MTIERERVDDDHFELYCSEQSEWDDIKKIVNFALEHYDETSLEYELSRDYKKGIHPIDTLKAVCALINEMAESPEKIHRSDFGNMRLAVGHTNSLLMDVPDISRDRHQYLELELCKPTFTRMCMEARLKERENTPE